MRLIDADKLMQFLYEKKDEEEQHLGIENDVSVMIGSIGFEVMNMPTAYEIDKVVEELEEYKRIAFINGTMGIDVANKMIEMVKAGGKND